LIESDMSLINDMLRDLDKRKQLSPQVTRINAVLGTPAKQSRASGWRFTAAIVASVVLGCAGGYAFFTSLNNEGITADSAVNAPAATAPLSAAPAQSVTAQPVSAQSITPSSDAVAQPSVAGQPGATPALASNVLDIIQEQSNPQGFSLRIRASHPVQYRIAARDTYGLTLHLDGLSQYAKDSISITGMSVLLESGGVNIDFDLELATDFLVYEDVNTPDFDIVLTASYRLMAPATLDVTGAAQPATSGQVDRDEPGVGERSADLVERSADLVERSASERPARTSQAASSFDAISASTPAANSAQSTPVKVVREQSLEERDRAISNAAIYKARGGQLVEAYHSLVSFVATNPQAHVARATLATLLLAQQDIAQAQTVVNEGLQLVPNHAGYKKIQARLLMHAGKHAQALQLLRESPPAVSADAEYHELLASLHQQAAEPAQAIAIYQDLIRSDAEVGRWWAALAIALEAQGKFQDALTGYQEALTKVDLDNNLRQFSQKRLRFLTVQLNSQLAVSNELE
jgi:tetratricopeptide (TPR) repeat protein